MHCCAPRLEATDDERLLMLLDELDVTATLDELLLTLEELVAWDELLTAMLDELLLPLLPWA